jgi:hypothetical protein
MIMIIMIVILSHHPLLPYPININIKLLHLYLLLPLLRHPPLLLKASSSKVAPPPFDEIDPIPSIISSQVDSIKQFTPPIEYDRSMNIPLLTCESFTYYPIAEKKSEHFLCSASLQPLYDPVQCIKNHSNCRYCLEKNKNVYPHCQDESGNYSATAVGVKAVLDNLLIICLDCKNEIKRSDYQHHRNYVCILPCSRYDCKEKSTRSNQLSHEGVCQYKIVNCIASEYGCNWKNQRKYENDHNQVCHYIHVLPAFKFMKSKAESKLSTTISKL